MTRRDLTEKEEQQIPVYLDSPFIEEDICYAQWNNQLVWSNLGVSPWYFDSNNKEIQDQGFEERFPGYKQLTGVQVDKETVTNQGIGPRQTDTESLCYKGNKRRTCPFGFPTGLGPDGPREIHAVTL